MVQKDLLAVRVSKEFIPKFEEACKRLKLKKPVCHRLALELFVKMVLQGEYQEVEEEEEGNRRLVVNVQNLEIQPHPELPAVNMEAFEWLKKILKVIAHPRMTYPDFWKVWAPIILGEIEKLEVALRKANKKREANTIYT